MKPKGSETDVEKIGKNFIQGMNRGFILSQAGTATQPHNQGDFAIFTDSAETVVDHCWFRGGWFDPLTITWESIRKGEVKKVDPVESGAPGASLYVPFKLGSRRRENNQGDDGVVCSAVGFTSRWRCDGRRKM